MADFGRKRNGRPSGKDLNAKRRKGEAAREITAVYVWQVPPDADEEELAKHFAKCGILQSDPRSGSPCVRLYVDEEGRRKGDAVVCYAKAPSVENAILLLDDAPLRPADDSTKIRVQKANKQPFFGFEADSSQKTKQALMSRDKEQTKMLSWADSDEEGDDQAGQSLDPRLKTVVLRNLFDPTSDSECALAEFKEELEEDLREECSKFGPVMKVVVFNENEDGVATVKFEIAEAARECIRVMSGRRFDGRIVAAEYWDGSTDFSPSQKPVVLDDSGKVQESVEEVEDMNRLDAFAESLEDTSK